MMWILSEQRYLKPWNTARQKLNHTWNLFSSETRVLINHILNSTTRQILHVECFHILHFSSVCFPLLKHIQSAGAQRIWVSALKNVSAHCDHMPPCTENTLCSLSSAVTCKWPPGCPHKSSVWILKNVKIPSGLVKSYKTPKASKWFIRAPPQWLKNESTLALITVLVAGICLDKHK